jgi:1,4-dihydroxy-2-naphthoate octaprenyltransferase
MKKKVLIGFTLLLIACIGLQMFIHFANDHKECEDTVRHYINGNGNAVVEKEHICKEKFSL